MRLLRDLHRLTQGSAGLVHDKQILFVGSPMCGQPGTMSNINDSRMTEEEEQRTVYGHKHLGFRVKSYDIQWRGGAISPMNIPIQQVHGKRSAQPDIRDDKASYES